VNFKDVTVIVRPGQVFVVMQFSPPYQQLYAQVIQPVAAEFKLHAYHIGEVFGPGLILQDIANAIVEAKIVIAEITAENRTSSTNWATPMLLASPRSCWLREARFSPLMLAGTAAFSMRTPLPARRASRRLFDGISRPFSMTSASANKAFDRPGSASRPRPVNASVGHALSGREGVS